MKRKIECLFDQAGKHEALVGIVSFRADASCNKCLWGGFYSLQGNDMCLPESVTGAAKIFRMFLSTGVYKM